MWPRGDSRPESRQAAVIDVGSNSVRLVIYRLDGRAIWTVYNEKALAGLGRDLPSTGRLSPDGVEVALTAIRRFRALLDGWRAEDVTAAATAAVREAADGPAFLKRVREETGLNVRVLSGDEEARYAALGVIAGQPDAQGVVGDLGGSSLELVRLNGAIGGQDGATLPLGPFALGAPRPLDLDRTRRQIEAALTPQASRFAARHFHAVGGAWRNLALFQMELAGYPLHVAHQYEMSRADALAVSRLVARQSRASLERMQGLSKKRIETLPYSAVVLEALIEALGVERVIISAFGVREGLLLDAMDPDIRARPADRGLRGAHRRPRQHPGTGRRAGGLADAGLREAQSGVRRARSRAAGRRLPPGRPRRAPAPGPSRRPRLRTGAARAHRRHEPPRARLPGQRRLLPPHLGHHPAGGRGGLAGDRRRPPPAGAGAGRGDPARLRPLRPQSPPAGEIQPDDRG
jgi:exopolyphosphatase